MFSINLITYKVKQMSVKQEAVLCAATELFSEFGFHAVGVDTIIERSKVAKMTFYKYFPSKNFLVESVLIRRDKELRSGILAAVGAAHCPMSRLKSIFDCYDAWFQASTFHGCMFIKASEEFPLEGTKVKDISRTHKSWLSSLMANILNDMNISSADLLAIHIMAVLDGLAVRSNMYSAELHNMTLTSWGYVKDLVEMKSTVSA